MSAVAHGQRAEVKEERDDRHGGSIGPVALDAAEQRLVGEQRGVDEALHVPEQAGHREEHAAPQQRAQCQPVPAVRSQHRDSGRPQHLQQHAKLKSVLFLSSLTQLVELISGQVG